MARPKGIPSYRLHKASGHAVVTIDGKDQYLGKYDSRESRAKYDLLLTRWLRNGRQLIAPADKESCTINQMLVAYVGWVNERYKDSVYRRHLRTPLRVLRETYGDMPAKDFGPMHLEELQTILIRTKIPKKGHEHKTLCLNYVNRLIGMIREVFKWGAWRQYVPGAIHDALCKVPRLDGRSGARVTPEKAPIPQADIDAVLPLLHAPLRAIVKLMLLTCARPGEICLMRMADIDTTKTPWEYRPSKHKTQWRGHARLIYLGVPEQEIIRPFKTGNADDYLFRPAEAYVEALGSMKIPRKKFSKHYRAVTMNGAIRKACKKAGVPRWTPHRLRHTAATNIRAMYGPEVANVMLGHKTMRMTEHYARPNVEAARRLVAERA